MALLTFHLSTFLGGAVSYAQALSLTPEEQAWIRENPVLRVSATTDWPPFEFVDDEGSYRGISVDLLRHIATQAGLELAPQPGEWPDLYRQLRDGSLDVAPALQSSPERREALLFTRPVVNFPHALFGPAGDAPLVDMNELVGRRVAVERDYYIHEYLMTEYPDFDLVVVENSLQALLSVARGDAGAYIGNVAVSSYLIDQNVLAGVRMGGYADIGDLELSMAVRRGAEPLVSILNKGIASLTPEFKRSIINRYTVVPTTVVLNEEERAWIKARPVIRLGVDPEFAPFEYVDEDGTYRGIAPEYIALLNERLGLNMEVVHTESWSDAVEQMHLGNLDVLPCLGVSSERLGFMDFTEPYISFHRVVITRLDTPFVGGLSDLAGVRVAVQRNTSHAAYIEAHRSVIPVYFDSFQDTLAAVTQGELDYAIGNAATTAYWSRKFGMTNLKLAVPLDGAMETLHFGVRKDWPELTAILNKGLASITEEEALAIRRVWMDVDVEAGIDMRRVWQVALGILAILVPLLLLISFHNRRLRKEIDARLETESALQVSERHYRSLVESVNCIILRLTPKGTVGFVNAFGESAFGYEPGEMLGQNVVGTILPETRANGASFEQWMNGLCGNPAEYSVTESKVTTKDGRELWIAWTHRALLDEGRSVTEVLCVGMDVTAQHTTAETLRRYDFIVNTVREMMSVINRKGCYEAVNDEWCAVMGIAREDAVGKAVSEVWPQRVTTDKIVPRIERCLAGETLHYESVLSLPERGVRHCDITMYPFTGDRPTPTHVVVVAQDITERKRTEEALNRAMEAAEAGHRAKSAFLANMSHEIRTPLNAVLGYTQLLLRSEALNPDQSHALNAIQRSGDHLLTLISDILELSRIEAGRLELYPESFSVARLLYDLHVMFEVKADAKGLQLDVDVSPDLPEFVLADRSRVNQVLINLVGNAMKFTEEGGVIVRAMRETLSSPSGETPESFLLVFEVDDTGVGIAPDDQETIFGNFEQAGATGVRQGGAGLGLSICRSFAELMGGGISLTSEPGKGSCFRFWLEARPGDKLEAVPETGKRRYRRLRTGQPAQRVLVVDDRDTNRDLLCRLLTDLGFITREAVNGAEAVEAYREWSPRIVLIDLVMPVMGGQEAIRRIRAMPPRGGSVTIIALTASTMGEEKLDVLSAGANAFLRKPFRTDELLDEIRTHTALEFEYDDDKVAPVAACTHEEARHALQELPPDLAEHVRSVIARGAITEATALAVEIRKTHGALAELLLEHAREYRLNELLDIIP